MKLSFTSLPAALTALISIALVSPAAGVPVSGDIAPRAAAAGIQMWSGADFTGNFYHYTAPEIKFDTCCKYRLRGQVDMVLTRYR